MQQMGIRKLWLAAALLAFVAVGYGVARGLLEPPGIEALRARLEPEPPTRRPPASFYSLPPADQLSFAWQAADRGELAAALAAAGEVLREGAAGQAAPHAASEALFLRASLHVRHLDAPWRGVADLKHLLRTDTGSPFAGPARLLLAETYLELGRLDKAVAQLQFLSRSGEPHPLGPDAAALLATLRRAGAAHQSALLPNNLGSLALSYLGLFAAFATSLLRLGFKLHDGSDPGPGKRAKSLLEAYRRRFRSRTYRLLFLCFAVTLVAQYQWNRVKKESRRAMLVQVAAELGAGGQEGRR